MIELTRHTIVLADGSSLSAILQAPARPAACLVLAHGAGAGMTHPFMEAVAAGLAERGMAVLRYNFRYMEQGLKRPDPPPAAHAAVRAAVAKAAALMPGLPLVAGGKSFGGRMTSQAQAADPLPGVRRLAFLGFPLHPPKQPSTSRADHLLQVDVPMLFIQGDRDAMAEPALLRPMVARLGARAELLEVAGADHSFHVPVRSGRTDAEVMAAMLDALVAWAA